MFSLELYLSLFFCLSILLYAVWQWHFEQIRLQQYDYLQLCHVFYCKHCGALYFGHSDSEKEAMCSHCATKNQRLTF